MIHYKDEIVAGSTTIRRITLDSPERANALTLHAMEDLCRAIADSGTRTIVLTGAGKSFCGGLDLDEIAAAGSVRAHLEAFVTVFDRLAAHPAPIISLVNGPAAAGGVGPAVCTDVCVARASATFTLPGEAAYAPMVNFLTTIIEAFRPGVSMDRFCDARVPVLDANDLVDHVVKNDASFDLDRIFEHGVPTSPKRKAQWDTTTRSHIEGLVNSASREDVIAVLLDALARRRR